ncbi:MAG TPA: hypothetical protein VK178_03110 [Opitutaceae bacterium]|nr:hypothetical protein [Opitutaceae bacterium]
MKTHPVIRGLAFCLLAAIAPLPGATTQFSAEVVDTRPGGIKTGTFHYQDKSYRIELPEGGQRIAVVVDGTSGQMRLLALSDKQYSEAGAGEPLALYADPFALYASVAAKHKTRAEGSETVAGFKCTKQVVYEDEQVFATGWVSPEIPLPLKVEIPLYGRTIELRGIAPGAQDAALFALPTGFTVLREPEEEPLPDWAPQVAKAPELAPPFQKTFAAGSTIRLRPQGGRHIRIVGRSADGASCTFTSVGFKDGRPRANPIHEQMTIDGDTEVTTTRPESPTEADILVIRVSAGSVALKVEAVDPSAPSMPAGGAGFQPAADTVAMFSSPPVADMASRIEVGWTGPGNKDDFVVIARENDPPQKWASRAFVRDGNPLKLWAPSEAGEYELRYIVGRGAKVIGCAALSINQVYAKIDAKNSADAAGWIDVNWEGPAAERDFIAVAQPQQKPDACVTQVAVKTGNPLRVRAPSTPGDYELRYVLWRGAKTLATIPLTVVDVEAAITPPASVKAGTLFEVRWEGPGYPEDFVSIARADQPPSANLSNMKLRPGVVAKIRAPKEAGTYEIRYVLGRGGRLLAKTTITVEPATP